MKIFCISEGGLYRIDGQTPVPVSCARIEDYLEAVRKMKRRDEWKTQGSGARFMNVEEKYYDTESEFLRGIGSSGGKLLYSTVIDGVGGIYFKEPDSGDETYIFADKEYDIRGIDCFDGKYCIDIGQGGYERHIALMDAGSGDLEQLTEGFTSESSPFISRVNSENIYYTAMGYARDGYGRVTEKSPCSVCMYRGSDRALCDIVSSPEYDYIKPSDDSSGNLYYIRRKYQPMKNSGNILFDILMFPVRIIKAIGGFLSMFSMMFGGEPLRTGGADPAKSRKMNERELFVEGNLIKAKKLSEKDKDEGIIPSEWTLIRRSKDGSETVLKKGVMDYLLLEDGSILYSDGTWVNRLNTGGSVEKLCRIKLANSLCVTE